LLGLSTRRMRQIWVANQKSSLQIVSAC